MATYSTNEFKGGLKIMIDGDPCSIIENEFVKPGKGQAFNRVKIRNLKTGRVIERTFKSGESVEGADVMDTEMQYLYNDGEYWHFMDNGTFEQYQGRRGQEPGQAQGDRPQGTLSSTTFIGNIMAGLMLRVVRSFRPGDFVHVGDYFGRVSEQSLFHVFQLLRGGW